MLTPDIKSPWKNDFPIFKQANNARLVFLDSAASAQKPSAVIEAISQVYRESYANVHRGVYDLSQHVSLQFEKARYRAAEFLNAQPQEIIFTRNATEGVNLVASGLAADYLQPGDEVMVTEMEHHANIVPWQVACQKSGAQLKVIAVTDQGELDLNHYQKLLNLKTKVLAVTAASNVLGTINPLPFMIDLAHQKGALVFIDGVQIAPHLPLNVQTLDAEFITLSGHKCYGPSGASVLWGKADWLNRLPPYQTGGAMINEVTFEKTTYADLPMKFEAGTPAIAEVIAMGVAFDYLMTIGMEQVAAYEKALADYAYFALRQCSHIELLGHAKERIAVFAFHVKGVHAHDVATILNDQHIAIRAGHHCAMPLHQRFKVPASVRASFGLYNDASDVDALIEGLYQVKHIFGE